MTRRQLLTLLSLVAAEIVSAFESSMIFAGLAAWLKQYGDPVAVGWIMTAYLLVSAAAAAICGRLGDMYGRKRMLLITLAGSVAGSLVSAFGPSLGWIIAGRALQGLAGAILPLCYGLAREHLPAKAIPFAVGVIVATAALSTGFGVLIGGLLTDHFGPHSIFYCSATLALASTLLVAVATPRSTPVERPRRLDMLGGLLFAPAVGGLLLAAGNLQSWPAGRIVAVAAAGLIVLTLWFVHEWRHADPLIDVRLLSSREMTVANLVICCAALGAYQLTPLLSLLMQQPTWTLVGLGTSATLVGLIKFPPLFAGGLSSVWAGWLAGRRGGRLPVLVGAVANLAAMAIAVADHSSVAMLLGMAVVGAVGLTTLFSGISNVIVAAAPPGRTSEATGLMVVVRALSQAAGAQLIAILLAGSGIRDAARNQKFPDAAAYDAAFWALFATAALALVLALALPSHDRARGARRGGQSEPRPIDRNVHSG